MSVTRPTCTVVFASNENGVLPLTVAAFSLVDSAHETTNYKIVVLSEGISLRSQEKITETIRRVSERHSVLFIEMSSIYEKRDDLQAMCKYWPISTWARIFIADLLPETARALYLDIDMLVCDDCSSLFSMDMQGAAVGAVYESLTTKNKRYKDELGIPEQYLGYFNAGTILMDLNVFRRDNLSAKILEFANNHKEHLPFLDQDSLNGVLYDKVIRLHPRWNWNDLNTRWVLKYSPDTEVLIRASTFKEIVEASQYPGIIHFVGRYKPWRYNYRLMRERYEAVMKKSGVSGYNLREKWSFNVFCRRLIYPLLYAMVWRKVRRLVKYFNITEPPPPETWGHSRDIAAKGWDAKLYR
ncbi:MAG: glycosyltransferase family 8 protein [Akkermansia sp.]|nr:glycosyltransferase family 8 protein [Akkermansia sp.]